jgi:hypothetical protein
LGHQEGQVASGRARNRSTSDSRGVRCQLRRARSKRASRGRLLEHNAGSAHRYRLHAQLPVSVPKVIARHLTDLHRISRWRFHSSARIYLPRICQRT